MIPAPAYVAVPRLGEERKLEAASAFGVLRLPMGDGLLGRVVDAQGAPMDRMGPIVDVTSLPLDRKQINAMDRAGAQCTGHGGARHQCVRAEVSALVCFLAPALVKAFCWA